MRLTYYSQKVKPKFINHFLKKLGWLCLRARRLEWIPGIEVSYETLCCPIVFTRACSNQGTVKVLLRLEAMLAYSGHSGMMCAAIQQRFARTQTVSAGIATDNDD